MKIVEEACRNFRRNFRGSFRGNFHELVGILGYCPNVHTCMYICHLAPPPPPGLEKIQKI